MKQSFEYQNLDIKLMILACVAFLMYKIYRERSWNIHKNNGYHQKALDEILKNPRLKAALGGSATFKNWLKKGENCLTADVARVIFIIEGANKKPGVCLVEAVFDEETFTWELSRVYLDFWPFPDKTDEPPVHIQVFPPELVVPERIKSARDQFVRMDKILKPEPKLAEADDPKADKILEEARRRQQLKEAIFKERQFKINQTKDQEGKDG